MTEYMKPEVQVIAFLTKETLATEETTTPGNEFELPSGDIGFTEGIEDW